MSWFLAKVVVPIIVLGVLVIVHEFGHFIVAKMCRVGVLKFAIGFGPGIFRFRKGETIYQVGCIPLGGFVRMVGDIPDMLTGAQATDEVVREEGARPIPFHEALSPEAEAMLHDRSRWFVEKGFWAKSAIVVAGPLFNFLLALAFIFFCLVWYGDRYQPPELGTVMLGSPAEKAGLMAGDLVTKIDGRDVTTWDELATSIHDGGGAPVALTLAREGQTLEITAQPEGRTVSLANGEKKTFHFLGITPGDAAAHNPLSLMESVQGAWTFTYQNTINIYVGIWSMIRGRISADELASPLYIVQVAGHHAQRGLEDVLYLTALLSVNLAVLNLLPIPILDGGHLMFFLLEALFGPISIRKKEVAQHVGLALLLALMVFAFRNDIVRKTPVSPSEPQKWESFAEPAQPKE